MTVRQWWWFGTVVVPAALWLGLRGAWTILRQAAAQDFAPGDSVETTLRLTTESGRKEEQTS